MANKQLGFWGHIKAALSSLNGPSTQPTIGYGYYGGGFSFGGFNSAADGYLNNEFVYQAAKIYLNKMKVAPIIVSKIIDEKSHRRYKEFNKSAGNEIHIIKAKEYQAKALEELDRHPLIDLLEKPNEYQTASEFRAAIAGNMKLGNGAFIIKDYAGSESIRKLPVELHVVPNSQQTVQIVYSGDFRNPIAYYQITIDAQTFRVEPEKMIYIKDWNPLNNYEGVSALYPGRELILTDKASRRAQARVFEHGGSATIISDDSKDIDSKMAPEQFEAMKELMIEHYHGKFKQIAVTNGAIKVQKIGDNPIDMEILSARKFNRGAISALLGVDGILIGDKDGATENNVEAAYKALVVNTIVPDQIHISECLEKGLLGYTNEKLSINFDTTVYPELQPDLKLMMEVYGRPPLKQNELRALFNYDQLEQHGDVILIPSGYETLDMVVGGNEDSVDSLGKSFDGSY